MTAFDIWHDEVEAQLRLEAVVHATEELMVGLEKDVPLGSSQFNNTLLDYLIFTNSFNSELLIRAVQCSQENTTKSAFANLLHQVEIFKRDVINYLTLTDQE